MTQSADTKPLHHGRLREEVIRHALAEARLGAIEGLSMRDLSRQLGVSPGAIYRHFEDRDAILSAVAQAGFDLLAERFAAALPFDSKATSGADAVARFEALAIAYVTFASTHYGVWRLMFGPYGRDPEAPRPERPTTYQWLGKALAELHAHGVIETATPEDQYFVWTAVHGLSDLQASPAAPSAPVTANTRRHVRLTLRALGYRAKYLDSAVPRHDQT